MTSPSIRSAGCRNTSGSCLSNKHINKTFKCFSLLLVCFLAGCYGRYEPYIPTHIKMAPDGNGIIVPKCKPYDISDVKPANLDCFVESSRWQMMVHPEKMPNGSNGQIRN